MYIFVIYIITLQFKWVVCHLKNVLAWRWFNWAEKKKGSDKNPAGFCGKHLFFHVLKSPGAFPTLHVTNICVKSHRKTHHQARQHFLLEQLSLFPTGQKGRNLKIHRMSTWSVPSMSLIYLYAKWICPKACIATRGLIAKHRLCADAQRRITSGL